MEPSPQKVAVGLTALRWLLAAVFLVAGVSKAVDPAATARAIAHYHLLPAWLAPWAGWYVPWLEISCGLALLSQRLRTGGWLLALLLSASFAVFTGSALLRGLDIRCGCFGPGLGSLRLPWMLAFDLALLLLGSFGLQQRLRLSRGDVRHPDQ
jgi:putative oxidoreductase